MFAWNLETTLLQTRAVPPQLPDQTRAGIQERVDDDLTTSVSGGGGVGEGVVVCRETASGTTRLAGTRHDTLRRGHFVGWDRRRELFGGWGSGRE